MRIFIALAAITVFVLSACSTTEPLTSIGDITGRKWQLQALDAPNGKRFSLPRDAPSYTLQFDSSSNKFALYWNCNFGGGVFVVRQSNVLRMDSVITTFRGCGDKRFDNDIESPANPRSLVNQLFEKDCTYNSDENRLRIWYDNGTKSADFVRVR
jgi:hypothetical protein